MTVLGAVPVVGSARERIGVEIVGSASPRTGSSSGVHMPALGVSCKSPIKGKPGTGSSTMTSVIGVATSGHAEEVVVSVPSHLTVEVSEDKVTDCVCVGPWVSPKSAFDIVSAKCGDVIVEAEVKESCAGDASAAWLGEWTVIDGIAWVG